VTGLGGRLPSTIVAVAEENAILTKTFCEFTQNGSNIVAEIELSSTSLDDHIEGSRTNGGIENITRHKVNVPPGSAHFWFTEVLETFSRKLESSSDLDRLRRYIQSDDLESGLSQGPRLLGDSVACAQDIPHSFGVHHFDEIPIVAEHVERRRPKLVPDLLRPIPVPSGDIVRIRGRT
jgi:hypothetical protein